MTDRVQAEWDRPLEYNACTLCQNRRGDRCVHPEVQGFDTPPLTSDARAATGACGIEARYLDFPGLEPAGLSIAKLWASVPRP